MKKILVLLILLSGLLIPFACSDKGDSPTKPSAPGGGNGTATATSVVSGPAGTPTPIPTFAVAVPPYQGEWGTISSANSMYLAAANQLYVAENDGINPQIEIFDPTVFTNDPVNGANYLIAGSTPTTILLKGPQGVAFTNGYYCVLDDASSGATIYVGATGTFPSAPMTQAFWGSQAFSTPKGFTADANGNLYVADTGNRFVEEFLATGSPGSYWLHRWNGYYNGSSSVTFAQPYAVACDTTGNVYVGDAGYNPSQITKFSSGGVTYLGSFPTLPHCVVHGLALDAAGNVYVADAGNHQVEEYDPSGNLLRYWGDPQGPAENYPFSPSCIVVTATHIFVGDATNSTIEVFGP